MDPNQIVDQYANSYPVANLDYEKTNIRYGAPNKVALWRVSTFLTKEPETVKWIAGFEPEDVFVDIGANMGLYSIFAAAHCGVKVYAFEPESQNYALLNKNIQLNGLQTKVVAWCCALTNERCIDRLYLSATDVAGSDHEFGAEVNANLQPTKSPFAQGCLGYTLDEVLALKAIDSPTHVKIDVDGIEHLVVEGAQHTFAQPTLKSVLIEISPYLQEHAKLISHMTELGFTFDPAQVERARRKEGNTKDYAEYIFWR